MIKSFEIQDLPRNSSKTRSLIALADLYHNNGYNILFVNVHTQSTHSMKKFKTIKADPINFVGLKADVVFIDDCYDMKNDLQEFILQKFINCNNDVQIFCKGTRITQESRDCSFEKFDASFKNK